MYVLEQAGADEFNIGFVCSWRDNPKDAEEAKANALLIAAAPDLLQAAEKVIEMNRQHAEDQYGDANKAETWSCVVVLRAAIARAKGEL